MSNPIKIGQRYICPHCKKDMYYDGRCGDGPVCTNPECPEKQERDYWADFGNR